MPVDITVFHFTFSGEQWHETDAVALLYGCIVVYACHLKDGGEEVLYHQVMVALGLGRYDARPADNHRFTYASFVGGTFTTVERIGLDMQLSGAGMGRQTAIVGHEDEDSVFRQVVLVQIIHNVSQTFVHTLNESSIGSFYRRKAFVQVLLVETHVRLYRGMDGIVCHVQKEWLVSLLCIVQGLHGLYGKGFT